jgi:hypothetical protein
MVEELLAPHGIDSLLKRCGLSVKFGLDIARRIHAGPGRHVASRRSDGHHQRQEVVGLAEVRKAPSDLAMQLVGG